MRADISDEVTLSHLIRRTYLLALSCASSERLHGVDGDGRRAHGAHGRRGLGGRGARSGRRARRLARLRHLRVRRVRARGAHMATVHYTDFPHYSVSTVDLDESTRTSRGFSDWTMRRLRRFLAAILEPAFR